MDIETPNFDTAPGGYLNGVGEMLPPMTTGAPQENVVPPADEPFSNLEKMQIVDEAQYIPDHVGQMAGYSAHLVEKFADTTGVDHSDKSDYQILHERIDELMRLVQHQGNGIAQIVQSVNATGQTVNWIATMLSGVAQMAQNMPGMGGMMARFLAPKGQKGGN